MSDLRTFYETIRCDISREYGIALEKIQINPFEIERIGSLLENTIEEATADPAVFEGGAPEVDKIKYTQSWIIVLCIRYFSVFIYNDARYTGIDFGETSDDLCINAMLKAVARLAKHNKPPECPIRAECSCENVFDTRHEDRTLSKEGRMELFQAIKRLAINDHDGLETTLKDYRMGISHRYRLRRLN